MSSQSSVPISRSAGASTPTRLRVTFVSYALVLLAAALSIPLRIPEVLQIAAVSDLSPSKFFGWIAQAPASAPLHPLVQLPFLLAGGHSRLAARFVSLVFAVAACYLFLRLAKRIPLQQPYAALLLFMMLPVHFELAFEAAQFEQALFLVVLATMCFFRLVSRPSVNTALLYAGCLALCLYTDRYSFLPAIGYLLFLLRFINRPQERRTIWYALAATAAPVLLFLPYALWAHTQVNPDWLEGPPAPATGLVSLRALRSVAAQRWAAYLLSVLLAAGVMAGAWSSFRLTTGTIAKRIRLFALTGGVVTTIVIALTVDIFLGERFQSSHLLWAAPAIVILLFAGLEWLTKRRDLRPFGLAATIPLLAVCAAADAQYLLPPPDSSRREDLQATAASVPGQLQGDSCVVFVSERFSRALFLVFEPELARHECLDFFHSRIVLAIHPYVTLDQQQDAESYFRGLDLVETNRLYAGGGRVVVMQQKVMQPKVMQPNGK